MEESDTAETDTDIGWINQLKDYFNVCEEDGKNVKVLCQLCKPKKVTLSTSRISPANLIKHVEVHNIIVYFTVKCIVYCSVQSVLQYICIC